ncbi:hypothetical protein CTM67_16695 [Photobacterium phosphoreum]|nr:hypothetical protein CTM67_16695 [Photobacterium phosphoreum]
MFWSIPIKSKFSNPLDLIYIKKVFFASNGVAQTWIGAMLVRNAIRRKEAAEDNEQQPLWVDKQLAKFANAAGKADKS